MPRFVVLVNEQTAETFEDIDEARAVARRQKLQMPNNSVAVQDLDSDYVEKYEIKRKGAATPCQRIL